MKTPETLDDILALLDRPIAFNRGFVDLTGSVNAALMLSQAFYWSRRTKDPEGWFYKSQDEWTKETGLTRREQEGARKLLRATGFWQELRKGNPAKMYYRLDIEAFWSILAGSRAVQTRMAESAIHESTEPPSVNGENSHTPRARPNDPTETTTEITNQRAALRSARETDKRRLMVCLSKGIRGPIPAPQAQAGAINWLLESGYSVDECEKCLEWLRQQKWRTTAVTWCTVKSEIANHIARTGNGLSETRSAEPQKSRLRQPKSE